MSPWVTVVGTLLGVLITAGFAALNSSRQRKWAVEDREAAVNIALEQWRREADEERHRRLHEERIKVYTEFLESGDRFYEMIMRQRYERTPLPQAVIDVDEAIGNIRVVINRLRIVASQEVFAPCQEWGNSLFNLNGAVEHVADPDKPDAFYDAAGLSNRQRALAAEAMRDEITSTAGQ